MKRWLGILLALVTLASLGWVATPIVLIRPFGAQTTSGLALSYAMRGRAPMVTLALLVPGLLGVLLIWPRLASWKGRSLTALAGALLAGCALLARANHFEWLFRPLPLPQFVEAARADHVAADDLVLGVQIAGQARAYPIRAMAYHHLVNDVIAEEPIVATY
jgi:uncharacterized protein DUF3179